MDAEGLQVLLERKRKRPCNEIELKILSQLNVRDCIKIWDDIAFTDADIDLTKYIPVHLVCSLALVWTCI